MDLLYGYADILEQTSIDEAYLQNSSNYPNVEGHVLAIKNAINTLCKLKSFIGVARTKSPAKIASNMRKPDGLTILYPNELQHFLKNLEVNRISWLGTNRGES